MAQPSQPSYQPPIIHDNVSLVETANKLLLDALMADPATRPFLLARIADTVALVQTDKFDMLIARMKKQGLLPKVQEH